MQSKSLQHNITSPLDETEPLASKGDARFFLRIISSMPVALAVLSHEGEFLYINQKFTTVFGYTIDELNKFSDWVCIGLNKEEYCQAILKLWDGDIKKLLSCDKDEIIREFKLLSKSGSEKLVKLIFNYVYGVITAVFEDISEKRKIENDLRYKNEQLLEAQRIGQIGSWVYNMNSNEISWSDEMFHIFGYLPGEEVPLEIMKRHLPTTVNNFLFDIKKEWLLKRKGRGYIEEFQILDKFNIKKYLRTHAEPFFNSNGGHKGTKGVLQDITNNKKQEIELQALNNTKDRLFSIIAHDLKNPIGVLAGLSDMLVEAIHNADLERIERYGNLLNLSANKSYTLLINLLDWSRAQNNKINFAPEKIIISEVLDEIFHLLAGAIAEKQIKIVNTIDRYQTIIADANMLKSIFRNIISNAIKYSHREGKVEIKSDKEGKSGLCISIADNGVGIKDEDKPNIFDPQSQFTTNGTEKESGTGLGLLVCKEFVERHSGKISFESRHGEGSVFRIVLPYT